MSESADLLTDHVISPSAAPTGDAPERLAARQPALDGLRGIAIAAVLYYHAATTSSLAGGSGGFLGVDLFFVLSGYLITGLLLSEYRRDGRIGLRGFWSRRFRRLFPAIVVTLLLVALWVAISPAWDRHGIRDDSIWTLLYLQNWHALYWSSSGFTPLSHTWSLSVEEQWYLIWPAALWAVLRWTKGRLRIVLSVVLGGALVSAVWTGVLYAHSGWPRPYDGTDGRAQELLIGAGLALLVHHGEYFVKESSKLWLEIAGWCGAAFIGYELLEAHLSDAFLYNGGFLLISLAAVLVILAATYSDRALGRALSWRPLVYVGVISYGLYLFHVPIFDLVGPGRWGLEGWWLFVVRLLLVFALAAVSFRFLEDPIRRRKLKMSSPNVFVPGIAAFTLAFFVIAVWGSAPPPSLTTQHFIEQKSTAAAGKPKLMVIGEWPALALTTAYPNGFTTHQVSATSYGLFGCGFGPGNLLAGTQQFPPPSACSDWKSTVGEGVAVYQPDVVALVVGGMEVYDRQVRSTELPVGSAAWKAALDTKLQQAVTVAGSSGAKVVLVSSLCPNMTSSFAPLASQNADPARYAAVGSELQHVAARRGVEVWDLSALLCPGGQPLRQANGRVVSTYAGGLTPYGSQLAWQWLAARARQATAQAKGS